MLLLLSPWSHKVRDTESVPEMEETEKGVWDLQSALENWTTGRGAENTHDAWHTGHVATSLRL